MKTKYHNSTLRAFNILAEISDDKTPSTNSLGNTKDLAAVQTSGGGYVARNARMSLMAAELVEPYVDILRVNSKQVKRAVIPGMKMSLRLCKRSRRVTVPTTSNRLLLQWEVGGAMEVDRTEVWYALWKDVPRGVLDCVTQPSSADIAKYFQKGDIVGLSSGPAKFSRNGASTLFQGEIDLAPFAGQKIVIVASARVDSSWKETPSRVGPSNVGPQSHIVNVRTTENWGYSNAGKIVQGRLDWFSTPMTVLVRAQQTK